MPRIGVALVLVCVVAVASCAKSDKPTGTEWQRDWGEFVAALGSMTKDQVDVDKMNAVFADKEVEWVGSVQHVAPPKEGKRARINVAMAPLRLALPDKAQAEMKQLSIEPTEEQWEKWAAVQPGANVVFRTKLVRKEFLNFNGVVGIMQLKLEDPNGGPAVTNFVIVHTEGAELVRVADR